MWALWLHWRQSGSVQSLFVLFTSAVSFGKKKEPWERVPTRENFLTNVSLFISDGIREGRRSLVFKWRAKWEHWGRARKEEGRKLNYSTRHPRSQLRKNRIQKKNVLLASFNNGFLPGCGSWSVLENNNKPNKNSFQARRCWEKNNDIMMTLCILAL